MAANPEITVHVQAYESSDYAGLDVGEDRYYYGYEFGRDADGPVYGFDAQRAGKEPYRLAYTEMARHPHCPGIWECQSCLLFGIGLLLAREKDEEENKYGVGYGR